MIDLPTGATLASLFSTHCVASQSERPDELAKRCSEDDPPKADDAHSPLWAAKKHRRTVTTATSTRHLFFVGVRFIKPVYKELVTTLKGLTSYVLVFKLVPHGGPFGHAREDERLSLNRLLVQKGVALGVTIMNVDRPRCSISQQKHQTLLSAICVLTQVANALQKQSCTFRFYKHLFLNRGNIVNLDKLATDQYNVCRVRGIQRLAFALGKALAKLYDSPEFLMTSTLTKLPFVHVSGLR
ncbi:uncharacterized protein ISCGN_017055 [Ixodes scapularis]